jgi:hypothetical protein
VKDGYVFDLGGRRLEVIDFLAEQIACVERILDGSCKGEPYQSFAGNGLVCRRGSAAVAFDTNNLRAKK